MVTPTLIRQSYRKLLLILPLAALMFLISVVILGVSWFQLSLIGLIVGAVATAFFGPAFFILLQAAVFPSWMRVDDSGLKARFYSVELSVPWDNIKQITAGMGWPSLVFHDPETVARTARFWAFPPFGWLLGIPTKFTSLLLCREMPNIYPTSQAQLLASFLSCESSFGFHYGMPSDLLELSSREILALLRRGAAHLKP